MPRDRNPHPLTAQRMKIRPDDPGLPGGMDREAIVRADEAFCAALRKAIEWGKERAIPHVIPPSGQ